MGDTKRQGDIDTLLLVIVQSQDADIAINSLTKIGQTVTRLPSVGGFLRRRNTTFLIGLPKARVPAVLEVLKETCRQRVEFIAVPLESTPLPLPSPTPINVGGAAVFAIDVEYYEEI